MTKLLIIIKKSSNITNILTFPHSSCGRKSLSPQFTTSFCEGKSLLSVVVVLVLMGFRVVVDVDMGRLVVVVVFLVVVEVEASGTHCPWGGLVEAMGVPSWEGVLGGRAHSGCKNRVDF